MIGIFLCHVTRSATANRDQLIQLFTLCYTHKRLTLSGTKTAFSTKPQAAFTQSQEETRNSSPELLRVGHIVL